jgi:GNAT superfamily N-acetyltransferase
VPDVFIRARNHEDIAECLELLLRVRETDGYPLHASPDEARTYFAAGHELGSWVAEIDGRIVGHVALRHDPTNPSVVTAAHAVGIPADRLAMVTRLFTSPDLRRAGLGRALLRHATAEAGSLGMTAVLDVGKSLTAAVALYEAERWTRVGDLQLQLTNGIVIDLWVYVSQPLNVGAVV